MGNESSSVDSFLSSSDGGRRGKYSLHTFDNFISDKTIIIWLDANANGSNVVYENSINYLKSTFLSSHVFVTIRDCQNFLDKMKKETTIMIVSVELFKEIWTRVKSQSHIEYIYIITNEENTEEYLERQYDKVKGVFTRVESIVNNIKRNSKYFNQDRLIMSMIPSKKYIKKDLLHLNQSFIYWMMVKQIVVEVKYDEDAVTLFTNFCRFQYSENREELKLIDEFEKTYRKRSPLWWYTRECFICPMLDRALQTRDIEIIIRMGFFIKDLDIELQKLQKITETNLVLPILTYRSQNLNENEFEKLRQAKGNLLTFNNIIIGDPDYHASLELTRRSQKSNSIGILFCMKIESNQTSSPYGLLGNASYYSNLGKYILFSMHSIFRIGDLERINDSIWKMDIVLTAAEDEHVVCLNKLLKQETNTASNWFKLGRLMSKLRDYSNARDIYFALLDSVPDTDVLKIAKIYDEFGNICHDLADFRSANLFHLKALETRRKYLPADHRSISVSYNNMGEIQRQQGEYFHALETQQKALDIKQKTLRPDDPSFAVTYNNLALANESLGDFDKALEYYQKALEIRRRDVSADSLELATLYNNIGELHRLMGDYPNALRNIEKSIQIRLSRCSPIDGCLAIPYNNLGTVYRELGDYQTSIIYLQKSLEIKEKTISSDHPSVALTFNNVGDIQQLMGEYRNALKSYQTAVDIQEKSLPMSHPEKAITFTNIGVSQQSLANYSEALSYFERALQIRLKTLPPQHPLIGTSYNNIGHIHQIMGKYEKALEYYQKTQKLQQKFLQRDHPAVASTYNNLADVHRQLKNYSKSLQLYQKSLDIKKKSLPENHPTFIVTYNNMGVLNQTIHKYPAALECFRQTLEIQTKTLPPDHPDMAFVYNNMCVTYQSMKDYKMSLEYCKKALNVQEKALPSDHPDLANTHNNLAAIYVNLGQYHQALTHSKRAVDMSSKFLKPDNPTMIIYKDYFERIKLKVESLGNDDK